MGEIKGFERTNKFGPIYEILCRRKHVSPLATIQAHLREDVLKFCCDRVNLEDWPPILNSLAADRSLLGIDVYSRYRPKRVDETIDTEEKLYEYRRSRRTICRAPIIYTSFLLRCLVDAVAVCAGASRVLTSLNFVGIPLGDFGYLEILCAGLSGNRSLSNISLARCRIGDRGCDVLLRAISDDTDLRHVNLTGCLLTASSAESIASFLKNKRAKILENVWRQSAVGCPDGPEAGRSSAGLETLVLDENRRFRDDGLAQLTRALKDDFWLKKLSLRRCGLTKIGGESVVDLLETNSVLLVLNLQKNDVPLEIVRAVRRLLKRRLENGERTPLKSRLIDRKKDLDRRSAKSAKNSRARNRRKIKPTIFRGRAPTGGKSEDAAGRRPNLEQLNERLTTVIDGNRDLMLSLANQRRLLVREKHSRITAERSYKLLRPILEKLRHGARRQHSVRCRILLESHLCSDLRKIFRGLESITEKSRSDERPAESIHNSAESNLIDRSFGLDENKRFMVGAPKRPYCPPRQKL